MAFLSTRGIFVASHVGAVRNAKGKIGSQELEQQLGKPLNFGGTELVPILDELKIIDLSLDILSDNLIPQSPPEYESGRLHFKWLLDHYARRVPSVGNQR